MYPLSKYKFYKTPDNKMIAVSSFAGKTVKGIAKLNPEDAFDEDFGKKLAAARCNLKVCQKREARAVKKADKAYDAYLKAQEYFNKMLKYHEDSLKNIVDAKEQLYSLGVDS